MALGFSFRDGPKNGNEYARLAIEHVLMEPVSLTATRNPDPEAFREVVLPLSLPGLMAGLLLCFVLAAGSYVTPDILGSTRDALFGNVIFDTIMGQLNWPMGSTLSIVLLVLLGIVAAIYSRYMGLSRIFKGLSQ